MSLFIRMVGGMESIDRNGRWETFNLHDHGGSHIERIETSEWSRLHQCMPLCASSRCSFSSWDF